MVSADANPGPMLDRRQAIAELLAERGDLLVVTGLGSPSYDVHAAGDGDGTYYLWGAMGAAALVGLGVAQAQPSRRVLVVTGDGEQLMGLGAFATIAVARPANLAVVVVDNERFGETGMQASHTARGLDLAAVAAACGWQSSTARTMADVRRVRSELKERDGGPRLYVIKVAADAHERSLPSRDAVYGKNRFRAALGLGVS